MVSHSEVTYESEAVRFVPSLFHGRARKPRQRGDQGIMPAPKSYPFS